MQFLMSKRLIDISIYYLTSLVFSGVLIFGIGFIHKDTIVFFAETNKPEFMQIYFSADSTYSDDASERTVYDGSPKHGIGFALPGGAIKSLRVDPSDQTVTMLIKQVQLRYLFYTQTLAPVDLMGRITPIQNIGKVELLPSGLLIEARGDDPQFELAVYKSSDARNILKLVVLSIIVSLVMCLVFLMLTKRNIKKLASIFALFAIPAAVSLFIIGVFYPGFMTYDTLHALYGARNGVTDSTWPPMVSYIWRVIDMVSYNPSLMHFAQVYLLSFSLFFTCYHFTRSIALATVLLVIYFSIPEVLGTVAAIWKDVLMTSLLMAGFSVALLMRTTKNRMVFTFLLCLSSLLVFLGVCSRHNAITAAVPIIFYISWIIASNKNKKNLKIILGVFVFGSILTGAMYLSKLQIDKYSLPGFHKLSGSTKLIPIVKKMDIAGASVCLDENLFSDLSPSITLAEIKKIYDPRHSNLSDTLLKQIPIDNRLDILWRNIATNHLSCFLNNKIQLAKYLVGANPGELFLVVAPQIDINDYGYGLAKSPARDFMVEYITVSSSLMFFKPWFLYSISLSLVIILIVIKKPSVELLVVFLSATFYIGGLVMFGNAADARLLFYTTTLYLLMGLISLAEIMKARFSSGMTVYQADQHNKN